MGCITKGNEWKEEIRNYKYQVFFLPNLSSPKLPQPIFLPTRKLGPTMRTPDEEVEAVELLLCRVPAPPAPTAELDDCIVLAPAKAVKQNKTYKSFKVLTKKKKKMASQSNNNYYAN